MKEEETLYKNQVPQFASKAHRKTRRTFFFNPPPTTAAEHPLEQQQQLRPPAKFSDPLTLNSVSKKLLDRSMLFLKRIEEDGQTVVHMSQRHKEMNNFFNPNKDSDDAASSSIDSEDPNCEQRAQQVEEPQV